MREKRRFLSLALGVIFIICVIFIQIAGISQTEAATLSPTSQSTEVSDTIAVASNEKIQTTGISNINTAAPAVKSQGTLISSLVASASDTTIQYIGKIVKCRYYVHVFKSPKTSSRALGHAKKGTTYIVNKLYDNKSWYQISYNGKTGYIRKAYVSLSKKTINNTINTGISSVVGDVSPVSDVSPVNPVISAVNDVIPAVSDASPAVSDAISAVSDAIPAVGDVSPVSDAIPAASDVIPEIIDAGSWYTIDNVQFNIDNTGNNARNTTDGINNALLWAKEKGYKNIKFADGTYLIQCNWKDPYIAPNDGILVPSGLTLDLGTSVFQIEPNGYVVYCIFGVVNKSNVTIKGGTLIGDRDKHSYASKDSTHEWGFGICVSASKNVLIQGVTIRDTTGDGIILEGSYDYLSNGGKVSDNVKVLNCRISNCRRQGISVIGAVNSEIAGNTIYDISGTDPQYGIDVESELDYVVTGLKIHDNTIYGCSGGAISACKGSDYEVYSNTCTGNNILAVFSSNVKIYDNNINNSYILIYHMATNITVTGNILDSESYISTNG